MTNFWLNRFRISAVKVDKYAEYIPFIQCRRLFLNIETRLYCPFLSCVNQIALITKKYHARNLDSYVTFEMDKAGILQNTEPKISS